MLLRTSLRRYATRVGMGASPWGDLAGVSRAVRVGDTIHVSGTVAPGDSCAEQVQGCFEVISKAIKDAGGRGLEDVVITRMIAADPVRDLDELASAHKAAFAASGNLPANTTFGGTLVRDWLKVEIEASAVVNAGGVTHNHAAVANNNAEATTTTTTTDDRGASMIIADVQVLPTPSGTSTNEFAHVDAAIAAISASGLKCSVHPLGTTIEGSADDVWAVARAAFDAALASGAKSEQMMLKLYSGPKEADSLVASGQATADANAPTAAATAAGAAAAGQQEVKTGSSSSSGAGGVDVTAFSRLNGAREVGGS